MLNRRILRIKAMQSIYAFTKCRASTYKLAYKSISARYHEIAMIEGRDKNAELLQSDREKSVSVFEENCLNKAYIVPVDTQMRHLDIAHDAIRNYRNSIAREQRATKIRMLGDLNNIQKFYLKNLKTLLDIVEFSKEKQRKLPNAQLLQQILSGDILVKLLAENQALQTHLKSEGVRTDRAKISKYYRLLLEDEAFFSYLETENPDVPQAMRVLRYFFKDFLLKHSQINDSFELLDLHWTENSAILQSMLLKTAKNLYETQRKDVPLVSLSRNWEEDKKFFEQLFESYWENEAHYIALLKEKSKRWDVGRIADVDKILIGMGVAEMLTFPGIPVKVTINEYIEIARKYSTLKSTYFLNGILDSIAKTLTKSGEIVKSGRGLIDK